MGAAWVLQALNANFTSFFWQKSLTVDSPDMPGFYDPFEHFDNGYIEEGWAQVQARLQQFQAASATNLENFHYAAHAIADFYAHSSYGHFGPLTNGELEVYDPENPHFGPPSGPDYGPGTTFDFARFTTNSAVTNTHSEKALDIWQGKIISGRYGQRSDSQGGAEAITFIPGKLRKDAEFWQRGLLPHHNEIAVDDQKPKAGHRLYANNQVYAEQYTLRYQAAVRHIRKAFSDNWMP